MRMGDRGGEGIVDGRGQGRGSCLVGMGCGGTRPQGDGRGRGCGRAGREGQGSVASTCSLSRWHPESRGQPNGRCRRSGHQPGILAGVSWFISRFHGGLPKAAGEERYSRLERELLETGLPEPPDKDPGPRDRLQVQSRALPRVRCPGGVLLVVVARRGCASCVVCEVRCVGG